MINNSNSYNFASTKLISAPVTVPANFVGMHFHRFPSVKTGSSDTVSPSPNYQYGTFRTHDSSCGGWNSVSTAQGAYDWTSLDSHINYYSTQGKDIIYTLYGTPTWAAKPADATFRDHYLKLGGAGMPADMQHVTDFINALFTRYPNKIKFFEIWNEPNFNENRTGFWWGSVQDLILLAKTVYTAVKAISPTTIVLSPGFTDGDRVYPVRSTGYTFLNTTHTASNMKGHQFCDAIAFHPYTIIGSNTVATRTSFQDYTAPRFNSWAAYINIQKTLGVSKDIYITEWGISPGPYDTEPTMQLFRSLSPTEQGDIVWKTLALAAAQGVKRFCLYSHESGLSGGITTISTMTETPAIIQALNSFAATICGKTISDAHLLSDGRVSVTMSTGEVYTR